MPRPLRLMVALSMAPLFALPAAAQDAARSQSAAVPDSGAQQLAAAREEMAAAQKEIIRLRTELANRADGEAALHSAREKNVRLVAITNELIAAYEQRYGRSRFAPFDSARRKLEQALQEFGDRAYDNRWDAGPRRPAAPPPESDPQAAPAPQVGQPDAG